MFLQCYLAHGIADAGPNVGVSSFTMQVLVLVLIMMGVTALSNLRNAIQQKSGAS